MTPHDEQRRQEFLAALGKDPYDADLHLVFADFLTDCGLDDEAAVQRTWTPEWQRAHDHLAGLASARGTTVDELIRLGNSYLDESDPTIAEIVEYHDHANVAKAETAFWEAFVRLTGRQVDKKYQGHFDDAAHDNFCHHGCFHDPFDLSNYADDTNEYDDVQDELEGH